MPLLLKEVCAEPLAVSRREAEVSDLRALYQKYSDFVRRAVIRLGGPRADVDDLVQEVFLVALRKHSDFEGRASASTWLYGIAIKVVAGARRRTRWRELLGIAPTSEPADPATPAQLFEHREASQLVYRLLEPMREKKRVVFILFELEQLSGDEIAAAVGCSVKTVWTRLHHARREFAARLAKWERSAR
jgi:RNA polymerase sigma-70 factor (ECF subfamily)